MDDLMTERLSLWLARLILCVSIGAFAVLLVVSYMLLRCPDGGCVTTEREQGMWLFDGRGPVERK